MNRLLLAAAALALLTWSAPGARAKGRAAKPAEPAATELWHLDFPGERPVASFFDAASGALYVSLAGKNGEPRVDRVSLEGKLVKSGVIRGHGRPGALRAFDGRLFWLVGDKVQSFSEEGSVMAGRIPAELGVATDIAIARGGRIYVGMSDGSLFRLPSGGETGGVEFKGNPISGLFMLEETLYVLRGSRLQSISLSDETDPASATSPFCTGACAGLERASNGDWLTTQNDRVVLVGAAGRARTILRGKNPAGRPAYVYRKDATQDFFVIPYPDAGVLRAYRLNPKAAP